MIGMVVTSSFIYLFVCLFLCYKLWRERERSHRPTSNATSYRKPSKNLPAGQTRSSFLLLSNSQGSVGFPPCVSCHDVHGLSSPPDRSPWRTGTSGTRPVQRWRTGVSGRQNSPLPPPAVGGNYKVSGPGSDPTPTTTLQGRGVGS